MDRRAAKPTAQTIHQRLIATVAGQRPDYTGERTERIRTIFVLRAVRHLARYHRPAQRGECQGSLIDYILEGNFRNI